MSPLNTVCNRRSVLSFLIMGLLTTLVIFGSPEFQGRKSLLALQDGGAEAKGGDAQIEEIMDEMKSAGRSFRRALRGNKVEDARKHVQRAQLATLKSKDLVPDMVAEMEDAQARAASLKEYRLMIVVTLEHWLKIERALLAGDMAAASEEAKKISAVKESGHEKFRKEED